MNISYWNGNGKFQEEYSRMVDELVPVSGNCATVAGEMIRAASRIAYDFYNNGMGNNTSGAVNYLQSQSVIDSETYETIYQYSRGRVYNGSYNGNSALQIAIERTVDQTIEMILNNPQLMTLENTEDMFDYEEEDQRFCEECGDEMEDNRGWICQHCEDLYEEEDEDDF